MTALLDARQAPALPEDFILGLKNKSVPSDCQVTVVEVSPGVYRWSANEHPYNCLLASPKKESKLKGLKSFIALRDLERKAERLEEIEGMD